MNEQRPDLDGTRQVEVTDPVRGRGLAYYDINGKEIYFEKLQQPDNESSEFDSYDNGGEEDNEDDEFNGDLNNDSPENEGGDNPAENKLDQAKELAKDELKKDAEKKVEQEAERVVFEVVKDFVVSNPYVLLVLVVIIVIIFILGIIIAGPALDEDLSYGAPISGTGLVNPEDTAPKGKGWTLKDNTDYSGVACATGSTDAGTYKHPTEGFTIRLCNTSVGKVASVNSQNIVNMISAAEKDGIKLRGSSFRSYERQQELYNQNCSGGHCNPPTAKPGNSMHERGLATDFSNSGGLLDRGDSEYKWLSRNASAYGYYNLPSEAWHWSTSGG